MGSACPGLNGAEPETSTQGAEQLVPRVIVVLYDGAGLSPRSERPPRWMEVHNRGHLSDQVSEIGQLHHTGPQSPDRTTMICFVSIKL